MAKKRKHRKPVNRNYSMAKFLFGNKIMAFTTGDDYCQMLHEKTHQPVQITPPMQHLLECTPFKWSVFMAALGKVQLESAVDNYIKGDLVYVPEPCLQQDLAPKLDELHQEILTRIPDKHLIGAAWFASPFGKDFSEEEAFKIFDSMGAFNRERNPDTGEIRVVS